jgi:hypothetical protein
MEELKKIQESFDYTINNFDLSNLSSSNIEDLSIDDFLDNQFLETLPIIGNFSKLIKTGLYINDRLFLKKISSFLIGLSDTSFEERDKMIKKIDGSNRYKIKVGEKLLYTINMTEDHETAKLIAILFKAVIKENITYDEFLEAAYVINKIRKSEFDWFINEAGSGEFNVQVAGAKIHTGLFDLSYDQPGIELRLDQSQTREILNRTGQSTIADVVSGGINLSISKPGEVIIKVFCGKLERPHRFTK